jgi:formylglycine-generating enzyme required for sulfatase activity
MFSDLNIVINIGARDAQRDAYAVQLQHEGKPLADIWARIDRQALLEDEHKLSAHDYGMELYNALFTGALGRAYDRLIGQARSETNIRVQLVIHPDAPELHALPWERLFHVFGDEETPLATSARTPFSRFLVIGVGDQPPVQERPLRLLLAVANPTGLPDTCLPLEAAGEVASLADLLAGLSDRVRGTLLAGRSVLPEDLRQRLAEQGWAIHDGVTSWRAIQRWLPGHHILHILAHGQFKAGDRPGKGTAYLLLEHEGTDRITRGAVDRVADDDIVTGLAGVDPLPRLIFLAACDSARRPAEAAAPVTGANPFVGLAPKLVAAGVPAVVAMQDEAPIDLARTVAADFYRRLFDHGLVDRAMNEARSLVYERDQFAWAIPVLFMRLRNGELIDPSFLVPRPPCPYPGMRPFTTEQSGLFFGRDVEVADLRRRLRVEPLIVVIGPSGSGKSSLVMAGLLPRLDATQWTVRTFEPGADPQGRLLKSVEGIVDIITTARRLDQGQVRLLVVVDQLEQIFAPNVAKQQRDAFIGSLLRLITISGVSVVLTVRADFYDELMNSALWDAAKSRRLDLGMLDDDSLRAAIVEPAARAGVSVEPALVERLVADAAHEPGMLPFVQETLVSLWESLEGRNLALQAYEEMVVAAQRSGSTASNGLEVAMEAHAKAAYTALNWDEQKVAQRILLRLIQLGDVERLTRRQQTEGELIVRDDEKQMVERVLESLARERLITLSGDAPGRERRVDLSHEALVHGWSSLEEWVCLGREAELLRREVEKASAVWQKENKGLRSSYLYRGVQLRQARKWAADHPDDVDHDIDIFLAAAQRRATVETGMLAMMSVGLILAVGMPIARQAQAVVWRRQARGPVVTLAAGPAQLGQPASGVAPVVVEEGELPPRSFPETTLALPELAMDRYEVSYERYRLCVRAGRCTGVENDPQFATAPGDLPVVSVTAFQAYSFCRWIGGRLPTEVEWERAVRGAGGRAWPWGEEPPTPDRANLAIDGFFGQELGQPVAVDDPRFARGITPAPEAGIMHLLGNVAEWTSTPLACQDTPYACDQAWNGVDPVPSLYIHGMGFADQLIPADPVYGVMYYELFSPGESALHVGFRCVMSE